MTGDGNENPTGSATSSRRRALLQRALKASLTIWAAGVGVPAAIYVWPMRREGPGSGTVKAGATKDLAVGKSVLVKAGGAPILLIRESTDKVRAFSAICTHLGCLVNWRRDPGDIFCPCHGGRFDLDGKVIGGPPPRPLPEYPVSIVDGEIQIKVNPE